MAVNASPRTVDRIGMVRRVITGTAEYSIWSLQRDALPPRLPWSPAWRFPEPKAQYYVAVGGGHGLATAYCLTHNPGMRSTVVLGRAGSAAATPDATP
jgi:hypothetical protein